MAEIDVWLPRKLRFLREPHRYKVLYGGRGGIKSWSIAQSLLIAGSKQDLRIPCARETMQSIKESVHQLLEDQITRLGMQGEYEVQKAEIKHRQRKTSFTFHGLRDQSVHNIKSLEARRRGYSVGGGSPEREQEKLAHGDPDHPVSPARRFGSASTPSWRRTTRISGSL